MDLPESVPTVPDEASSIISMHDFLDFLKLTCQINEHLEEDFPDNQSKIDYKQLSKNHLINSLRPKTPAVQTTGLRRQDAVQQSASNGSMDKKGKPK